MIKLTNIAEGWFNLATDRNRELALQRLEICDGCEFKRQFSPAGTLLLTNKNSKYSIYYCGDCGCPLKAKVRASDESCTKGKWGPVYPPETEPDSYY